MPPRRRISFVIRFFYFLNWWLHFTASFSKSSGHPAQYGYQPFCSKVGNTLACKRGINYGHYVIASGLYLRAIKAFLYLFEAANCFDRASISLACALQRAFSLLTEGKPHWQILFFWGLLHHQKPREYGEGFWILFQRYWLYLPRWLVSGVLFLPNLP